MQERTSRGKEYTEVGLTYRAARFRDADRHPVFSGRVEWGWGPCATCGVKKTIVKASGMCGACHIERRRDGGV